MYGEDGELMDAVEMEHELLPPFNPTEYFREMIFMTDFFNESDQLPMQMCDDGAA